MDGPDRARFTLDGPALRLDGMPNFEAPDDADGDNVYLLVLEATLNGQAERQPVAVEVTDVDEAPRFVSESDLRFVEGSTVPFHRVVAEDPEGRPPRYRIIGGDDAAAFRIGDATGDLAFAPAPTGSQLQDADADGIYQVRVEAEAGPTTEQALTVTYVPRLRVNAQITFPTEGALFPSSPTLAVSGGFIDEDGDLTDDDLAQVREVDVNGVTADVDRVARRWSAIVPASTGTSTVTVTVRTRTGDRPPVQRTIQNRPLLWETVSMALDDRGRLLLQDRFTGVGGGPATLSIYDPTTGTVAIVSDGYRGTGPRLSQHLLGGNAPLLVRDSNEVLAVGPTNSLLSLDLSTADRTALDRPRRTTPCPRPVALGSPPWTHRRVHGASPPFKVPTAP